MLKKIQMILKKYKKQLMVMYNYDNSDKYFCKYISGNMSENSICIISQTDIYLIINEINSKKISQASYNTDKLHIIVYDSKEKLKKQIEDIIAALNFPTEILLSYSTMGDPNTDILTHGEFLTITKLLKEPYVKYSKKIRFASSEKIIYEIESVKKDKQISRLRLISNITIDILAEAFKNIKVGLTEIQIANIVKSITGNIMSKYIGTKSIKSFDFAWDNCPIVLAGINLAKGGHSLPSEKKLLYGDTIYFDFGIKVEFNDGEILYSDIQRMGYALKTNETEVPKNVQKVFDTLVKSIENGMEEMKPGIKGYKIDELVRGHIIDNGYPDYVHASGHPVGLDVHDIGTIINNKHSKRANLELVENGVYTLEPRINISNGGSIEEMILVTKYGGVPLCRTQNKIYIIK